MSLDQNKSLYKNLFAIFSDEQINDVFVKFATIEYNKSIRGLKSATDPLIIGRMQGQVAMAEMFMNIKEIAQKATVNG